MSIGRRRTHFAMLCTAIVFLYFVSAIHAKSQAARLLAAATVVDPRTQPMTFRAYQECSGNGCPYFVLAQGVITPTSPRAFQQFLSSEKYQPVVYFDSPGGGLSAALELGRLIRARGLDTYVGGPYEAFEGFAGPAREINRTLTQRGICFSACAYAFLGGVSREIHEGGSFGVHQFYSGGRPLGDATTQVAMTTLISRVCSFDRSLVCFTNSFEGTITSARHFHRSDVARTNARNVIVFPEPVGPMTRQRSPAPPAAFFSRARRATSHKETHASF